MSSLIRCLCAAIAVLALIGGVAVAHSPLDSCEPADGASLDRVPAELVLRFKKRATVTRVTLAVAGQATQKLTPRRGSSDSEWLATLPDTLNGDIKLVWRALSADGHPVKGTINFTVKSGSTHGSSD
ncbi:MAG: copper resistance CopC family protein [Pseudomonadota bacterium]